MRDFLNELNRYIITPLTAVHRIFLFLTPEILPDQALVVIGSDDAFHLGILSSKIHLQWIEANAGSLGAFKGNIRYNKSRCFEPFPFPAANAAQKALIRALGEALDAHRKRQQAQHPSLTLTDIYNVLEKVRAGERLNEKEKEIHQAGLVSILKQIHDDLDAAVFAAYGWSVDLSDEEILQHLVDLNAERAAEEAQGQIRWLRPEYQAPGEVQQHQPALMAMADAVTATSEGTVTARQPYPETLKERATAIRAMLAGSGKPVSLEEIVAGFEGRRTEKRINDITEIVEMLIALGQVREENGKYSAS